MPKVLIAAWLILLAAAAHAIETKAKYAYMTDFNTGTVLLNKGGEERMHPSSMSKLMTTYILFDKLKSGAIKLDSTLPVSERAWRMGGSKMFVHVGEEVAVEDLIRGIVVQSGNDACVVVADGISGSEEVFAALMNVKAKELGLTHSNFTNSTGWPDENHLMSARDLAVLASRTIGDFPEYYPYYAEKEFTFNNITQPNRNRLLHTSLGVDGLKTGHTEAGGFGITLSAKDSASGRRVVLVINGLPSDDARVEEGGALLRWGLGSFANKIILKQGEAVEEAPVWFGSEAKVPLVAKEEVVITLPKENMKDTAFTLTYEGPIPAPVEEGAHIADLTIAPPGMEPITVPLYAGSAVPKATGLRWYGAAIDRLL